MLDAGVGTGCNMPFYAPGAWVVGVDLLGAMLARARAKAAGLGVVPRLAQMDIRRTAFAEASLDAAVASFLFCVLADDDQLPALHELKRIVRPGGEIRLLEYVYSRHPYAASCNFCGHPGYASPMARASTARPRAMCARSASS